MRYWNSVSYPGSADNKRSAQSESTAELPHAEPVCRSFDPRMCDPTGHESHGRDDVLFLGRRRSGCHRVASVNFTRRG